jgi:predicted MFS family arabinose efflux permease
MSVVLAGHLAIGMVLGAVFALVLLFSSDPPILQLILNGSSPALALVLYIGVFAITFGLGSTLTGLVLDASDEQ